MLNRERVALRLLEEAGGSLPRTKFVKLLFLLRMEKELKQIASFYDFVPYKYGPFSFALYRDIERLESRGFLSSCDDGFALDPLGSDDAKLRKGKLPQSALYDISGVWRQYGGLTTDEVIVSVYQKFPWYAINSEREERNQVDLPLGKIADPAVYTTGYEGKSIDGFLGQLLEAGIQMIIDVRANPVSRKYGFAGSRMKAIAAQLGIAYRHYPSLGIPSESRGN